MKYTETGFRPFYRSFCVFSLNKDFKKSMADFPGIDEANCFLTYGYIDKEAGMTLEVLAAGIQKGENYRFFESTTESRFFIRAEAIKDAEFGYFGKDEEFEKRYAVKIEMLSVYEADEYLEKTRELAFLDECRHPYYPDDVQVYLTKEGLEPELCWANMFALGDHWIMAYLLNEPKQSFGYHEGEKIAFFVKETEDKHVICYSEMTPSKKITAEDLEDGTYLKSTVTAFNNERTEPNFLEILETLRDSYVWIPCQAVLSDVDQEALEKLADDEDVVGKTFSTMDDIRMIPDILQNGEDFYFPIFSSAEEMGEYGMHFSKIQKHFLEALALAINNGKNVKGIVLNAFTESFVLDREIFDIVQNMKSRLE